MSGAGRRTSVVDAALDLLDGEQRLGDGAVARAAGVSAQTVDAHVATRPELLVAAVGRAGDLADVGAGIRPCSRTDRGRGPRPSDRCRASTNCGFSLVVVGDAASGGWLGRVGRVGGSGGWRVRSFHDTFVVVGRAQAAPDATVRETPGVERIRGVVQHYAWGHPDVLPELLGLAADGRPWAELWLGTHPGGHATAGDGARLADVSGDLPYLLKVLSAAEPLSLQTHPDAAGARAGFAREEAEGRAHGAADRVYRDPNAKPELIVAITDFDALCGFRRVSDTDELLRRIGAVGLADQLRQWGLGATVAAIYRGGLDAAAIVEACRGSDIAEAKLVVTLADAYPNDPSVIATLLLNRVQLAPGDGIYLGPGNLHAYLRGTGVEIMGASDNVIRGGLTTKHVDVGELLSVLDFTPLTDPVVRPAEVSSGRWCYDTPHTPFRLWRFDVAGTLDHVATGRELLLCTDGDVGTLSRGESVYLAPDETVRLTGAGTVFRVEEVDTDD